MASKGGAIGVTFNVTGTRDVKRAATVLRSRGSSLQDELTKRIREVAAEVLTALRRSANTIPNQSPAERRDGKSLRAAFANACTLDVTDKGVRLYVDGSKMPDGATRLAFAFEKRSGFRHPVYGTNRWVEQKSHPWFNPTVRAHADDFEKAVRAALATIVSELS